MRQYFTLQIQPDSFLAGVCKRWLAGSGLPSRWEQQWVRGEAEHAEPHKRAFFLGISFRQPGGWRWGCRWTPALSSFPLTPLHSSPLHSPAQQIVASDLRNMSYCLPLLAVCLSEIPAISYDISTVETFTFLKAEADIFSQYSHLLDL